ncbi:unnamed protein product [Spirodela intermedia]|uniref:Uncharacterized protein n=1 Tax=Spirodela intermedia TaxID=51605 RepID=A0A7I8IEX1_SPIIN|nr:unnamed protein product [Spirodela intermedia]CAA6656337.1 unnamed protein product [Spirodela intermedia]
MAQSLVPEAVKRIFTPETLHSAARQSEGISLVPLRLRRAIKKFLREKDGTHMHRKVLLLSESLCSVKKANLGIADAAIRELIDDPLKSVDMRSRRWKIRSSYGDIGLSYHDDETSAYVASRMPAFSLLAAVRRRLPDFSPSRVLDFGAGPGTAIWAMREIWPHSLEHVNLIEPSKSMQRACQSLLQNSKNLPLIRSYDSLQALSREIGKHERGHDLVIASYVLGEIPSLSDRITLVRQLWSLTKDVLVRSIELLTRNASRIKIICQMRSHILWMSKRKCRKMDDGSRDRVSPCETDDITDDVNTLKDGAFVIAPCPHDGPCPLENSTKYCHFVQRLERTSTQRMYKRSKGRSLRGFEDEKFSYVAFRRGSRPRETWPLDGIQLAALENTPDEMPMMSVRLGSRGELAGEGGGSVPSDMEEAEENGEEQEEEEEDGGGGRASGRLGEDRVPPVRRGRHVAMDVCRARNLDGSEGAFERVVVTRSKNPMLHRQARNHPKPAGEVYTTHQL